MTDRIVHNGVNKYVKLALRGGYDIGLDENMEYRLDGYIIEYKYADDWLPVFRIETLLLDRDSWKAVCKGGDIDVKPMELFNRYIEILQTEEPKVHYALNNLFKEYGVKLTD